MRTHCHLWEKTSRLGVRWEILRCRQDKDLNPASAIASASGAAVHRDLLSFNPDCPAVSLSPMCADLRVFPWLLPVPAGVSRLVGKAAKLGACSFPYGLVSLLSEDLSSYREIAKAKAGKREDIEDNYKKCNRVPKASGKPMLPSSWRRALPISELGQRNLPLPVLGLLPVKGMW